MNDTAVAVKPESEVDYVAQARALAQELKKDAAERDARGGHPAAERDMIRKSGLLNIMTPKEYGGLGGDWVTALRIVREIGKADGSLAHVFGYHLGEVTLPHLIGSAEQKESFYRDSAANNWFCGNASSEHYPNLFDWRTKLYPDGDGWVIRGTKHFCSGAKGSDRLFVFAGLDGEDDLLRGLCVAVIPTDREGIKINDDWDNMGQRLTDSGSVEFHDVRVSKDELLGTPGSFFSTRFGSLWSLIAQLAISNVYLGIGLGAIEAAKEYTRTTTRAWPASGVEKATQDRFIIQKYGDMWVDLMAAVNASDYAAQKLQVCWDMGDAVTAEARSEGSIAISIAKVLSTRVSLAVSSKIFEVMGARATAAKNRMDRFWRNARTHTLHDPVDYKVLDVGNWYLNDEPPMPSFTS